MLVRTEKAANATRAMGDRVDSLIPNVYGSARLSVSGPPFIQGGRRVLKPFRRSESQWYFESARPDPLHAQRGDYCDQRQR